MTVIYNDTNMKIIDEVWIETRSVIKISSKHSELLEK